MPARARATAMTFSRSSDEHRPRPTGFCGLMLAAFQWERSRTEEMVGLVVPISLEICPSDISG